MSSLILCRTKEAVRPFSVRDMGLRIYSLEELCYLVYNNIYVISKEFFSDGLMAFIEDEIEEKELAYRLNKIRNGSNNLAEMVVTLLMYVDYYTTEEIMELKGVLETLENQNVCERLKVRGDTYLENSCYYSAIRNYSKILDLPYDTKLPAIFYAKVNHNMGVAYAKLLIYNQAYECFMAAYKISQDDVSKRYAIAAKRLASGDNIIETEDMSELEYVVKRELETLMDNARYSDEYRKLTELGKNKDSIDISRYFGEISELLNEWKQQYVKYKS